MRTLHTPEPTGKSQNCSHLDSPLSPGSRRCACGACGALFGGVGGFEQHRTGPANARYCRDPQRLMDNSGRPLLRLDDRGIWVRHYGKRAPKLEIVQ